MRIVITQPDAEIPLATVEVDMNQYDFRGRPYHAGIRTYGVDEWKFAFDEILRKRGIMRIAPWEHLPNTNYSRHLRCTGGFKAFVQLEERSE